MDEQSRQGFVGERRKRERRRDGRGGNGQLVRDVVGLVVEEGAKEERR